MGVGRRIFVASGAASAWALGRVLPVTRAQEAKVGMGLPSWNEGPAKKVILDFVFRVTREGSPNHVPVGERIAVFDNDGTLWCEQPMYIQLAFGLDRVKALAGDHPEWKEREPFRSALAGDLKVLAGFGERGLIELLMATHAGTTPEQFARVVEETGRDFRKVFRFDP